MPDKLLPTDLTFDGPFPRLSRRLRLGVVGGGRISETQATAARLTGQWEVVAGALSSDPARSAERGKLWYLDPDRSYSSFEVMAAAEADHPQGVDAVMITTPNNMHFPAAKAFLEAGISVICDKPLTNELDEAHALVATTHDTNPGFRCRLCNVLLPHGAPSKTHCG